ncbi:hypothetical protein J8273_6972 [Carpediemonas membranifera]|uniref:Uncharacterized protein n=1 Tax=Carpediemonas membranifera TaxID=201153 RepID=A0A8J6B113_9EUKA|nr:hypothetical protein J8273_6972 [Carpediemonas membranifera]|eukprot:KAG9390722.1 hypothetical protein J8273_6972 [Carpediemonas membranifera]
MSNFDELVRHLLPFFTTSRARTAFKRLLDKHVQEDQLPNRQRTYRAVFAPAPASVTSDDATSPSAPAGDLPPAPSTEDAGSSADEADDAAAEDDEPHPTPEETEAPVQAEATAPNDPVEAEPQLSEMVSRVQACRGSYPIFT